MYHYVDEYSSLAELKRDKVEGVDYRILVQNNQSAVTLISPHGGFIESGTSMLAQSIAAAKYNFYDFQGLDDEDAFKLHVTSTRFEDKQLNHLLDSSNFAVSIHGMGKSDTWTIWLGGLNAELKALIGSSLAEAGFSINLDPPKYRGEHKKNIVNRPVNAGAQIELPDDLMNAMFQDCVRFSKSSPYKLTELGKRFVAAVQAAISKYQAGNSLPQISKPKSFSQNSGRGNGMLYRLRKIASSGAYLVLIWLTWQWFQGDTAWTFSIGCTIVSGLWLGLTVFEVNHLFRTYFDILSRLKMLIPITLGISLSALALWFGGLTAIKVVAGIELALWLGLYLKYRANRKKYITQGHGPLPKGTWVNPPPSSIQEFDLILTSGNIARQLRESVGHGEVAVTGDDGELYFLSAYMESGVVYDKAETVCQKLLAKNNHYVVLRPTHEFTADQKAATPHLVRILIEQNAAYVKAAQAKRSKLISKLPIFKSWKLWLEKKFKVTGYDWLGLLIGQTHNDRWTCVGLCLELYHRLGVKTATYGTGLLGLGTGLLDPIMPVRFLNDPAFEILTVQDRDQPDD